MNAVIGDELHQRAIDRLLFLHAAHLAKQLTHSNDLKVAAIAGGDVDFWRGSAFISTV